MWLMDSAFCNKEAGLRIFRSPAIVRGVPAA